MRQLPAFVQKALRGAENCTEAEFMNAISLRFLGIILRVLRLEISIYNVHHKPVATHFCSRGGGGVKSVSRGDCE
jgi:hypothetical protein